MQQEWKCLGCHEQTTSKSRHFEQANGRHFMECSKCGAKNIVIQIPSPEGAPAQFEIMGLLKQS